MRRALSIVAACVLAACAARSAGAESRPLVSAFFYPWYGTPALDGRWIHWGQNASRPPLSIASAFWPARGLYSSGDARVLAGQMEEMRAAGINQVVVSWWGRGSLEDRRLRAVVAAARAEGLSVAVHVEPYPGRTPASVATDAAYLRGFAIHELYVYGPTDATPEEWAVALGAVRARVYAQTHLAGFAARGRFAGLYTYDILVWGGAKLARICAQAHATGIQCAPSVGPGYDAQRSIGDTRVKQRRDGQTYDSMWRAAIRSGADSVTITSYNEWHEGTQIEPARSRTAGGQRFAGYDGAWGFRGRAARRSYLDRTAYWAARLRAQRLALEPPIFTG